MAFRSTIFLRRAEREDLDTVVAWMEDPDFLYFLYGDATRSPRQIREHIVAMLGRTAGHTMPAGVYLLIDSTQEGPIGLISLQNISWRNRACSLDVYIGAKKIRAGIMAAVSLYRALEYCFDELNLHRVGAFIYEFNPASWRILEGFGMKREMILREHVARDGKLYAMYCYGILRDEFNALRDRYADKMSGKSLAEMIAAQRADAAETAS